MHSIGSKGVSSLPSTVGVVDGLLGKLVNVEGLDLNLTGLGGDGDNSLLGTLGNDGDTSTLGVLLGGESELLGDLNNVVSTPLVALRVDTSLSLVADGVVSVRENTVQLLLEELGDERSGQGEHEGLDGTIVSASLLNVDIESVYRYLVLGSSLLSKGQDGRDTDSQVETTDEVVLGLLDEVPDVGLLQVLELVLVGSSKVSAQAAVVASDDSTTLASGLGLVHAVLSVDTGLLAGTLEGLAVVVVTDTTNVQDGVVGEQVLSTTSSVLGSTTGDELSIQLHQILVETHVLVLGENGIVSLQAILLQKSIISTGLDVEERVLQAQKRVTLRSSHFEKEMNII